MYNQFTLDQILQKIITFYPPWSIYRYKQMAFTELNSQDLFVAGMTKILSNIPLDINSHDDIN